MELLIKVTNWFYPQETAASWHLPRRILSILKLELHSIKVQQIIDEPPFIWDSIQIFPEDIPILVKLEGKNPFLSARLFVSLPEEEKASKPGLDSSFSLANH